MTASPPPNQPYPLYVAQGGLTWSADQPYGCGAMTYVPTSVYVANAPHGEHVRTRFDTFARADSADWGLAPVGGSWAGVAPLVLENITDQVGYITASAGPTVEIALLGDVVGGIDSEVLVKWAGLSTTGGHVAIGLRVVLRYNDTGPAYDLVKVKLNGDIAFTGASTNTDTGSWDGATKGTVLYSRVRASGKTYTARTWPAASAEPTSWDWTYTDAGATAYNGKVGLSLEAVDATDSAAIHSFEGFVLPTAPGSASGTGSTAWDVMVTGV